MYEKHFSFKFKPFNLVPNPDFLFLSNTHKKAITYLEYGIKEKIGFVLLTGEIGSGKTTIIRNLLKNLDDSVKISRVNNTKVTSEQLITMVNEDFGLEVERKNKTRLLSDLNQFLIEQYSNRIQPVLLIDEAQNLSPDLLEEVRLLSNLETDRAKLIQIILVGQPELRKTLMLPELTQLRQRINISYHIAPLTIDETARYIQHRLNVAGNCEAMQFRDDMLYLIYQFSRGIPRLINIVCDFSLLAACVEGHKAVSADTVREVVKDLDSGDFWSDDSASSDTVKENKPAGVSEAPEDTGARLGKLEKMLEKMVNDISVLDKKIYRLEKDVSNVVSAAEIIKIRKLLEQITGGENALVDTDIDREKPFEEQIDILNEMLSNINARLKKAKI